jgi:hypothetical protein
VAAFCPAAEEIGRARGQNVTFPEILNQKEIGEVIYASCTNVDIMYKIIKKD